MGAEENRANALEEYRRKKVEGEGGMRYEQAADGKGFASEPKDPALPPEYGLKARELREEEVALKEELDAIKRKIEMKKARAEAVEQIPVLFDDPATLTFADLGSKFDLLSRTGIKEIKIGQHVYPVERLISILDDADKYVKTLVQSGQYASAQEIDKFLADLGVTAGKISQYSQFGFRQCVARLINRAQTSYERAISADEVKRVLGKIKGED